MHPDLAKSFKKYDHSFGDDTEHETALKEIHDFFTTYPEIKSEVDQLIIEFEDNDDEYFENSIEILLENYSRHKEILNYSLEKIFERSLNNHDGYHLLVFIEHFIDEIILNEDMELVGGVYEIIKKFLLTENIYVFTMVIDLLGAGFHLLDNSQKNKLYSCFDIQIKNKNWEIRYYLFRFAKQNQLEGYHISLMDKIRGLLKPIP